MYVRMTKSHDFKNDRGEKVTAPRGWVGELPDKVAEDAIEKGRAVDASPTALTEAKPEGDDLDGKTKAELEALAKERGVDIAAAKTKDDILKALRAAR